MSSHHVRPPAPGSPLSPPREPVPPRRRIYVTAKARAGAARPVLPWRVPASSRTAPCRAGAPTSPPGADTTPPRRPTRGGGRCEGARTPSRRPLTCSGSAPGRRPRTAEGRRRLDRDSEDQRERTGSREAEGAGPPGSARSSGTRRRRYFGSRLGRSRARRPA